MLSSIHPLGERARHNRWFVTVTAFTVAAVVVAGVVGSALGAVGAVVVGVWSPATRLVVTGVVVALAAALDLLVAAPGPKRQVNEHWIGHFRGWVYGGSFGAELGVGLATYVVTWTVYATLVAEFLTADWRTGLVVGVAFGLGRSIILLAAGWVDRPSRLTSFNRRLAMLGPSVRRTASGVLMAAGSLAVLGGVL